MTPTDATRPAPGPAPDSGHTETHDAREGLRGLLGDRYGAFATALLHSAERLAEVTAERDALAASVARVRVALDSHPDPTRYQYASKGPISCGWKSALIDVRWALADGSGS